MGLFEPVGKVEHNLLGHATYIDASTTNDTILNKADTGAILGGTAS